MIKWGNSRESLGLSLKAEREEQGLSLAELSRRSGISASTIRQIERGQSNAYLSTIIAIVDGLGKCQEVFGREFGKSRS